LSRKFKRRNYDCCNVLKFIKEKEVEFVDLRFSDPRGKLQHLTMDHTIVDEEMLNKVFFLMVHQ